MWKTIGCCMQMVAAHKYTLQHDASGHEVLLAYISVVYSRGGGPTLRREHGAPP